MNSLTYSCEIITPMFLGGATGTEADLRAPSVKGVLRYWWRVLKSFENVKEMHKKEAEIFGSSHPDYQLKSKVTVKVIKDKLNAKGKNLPQHNIIEEGKNGQNNLSILNYLAFGTYDFKKGFTRDYFTVGSKFKIQLTFDDRLSEKDIQDIKAAMYLCSFIGGLGSKSRNGFGKFAIAEFYKEEDYYTDDHIKSLLHNTSTPREYTATSNKTKIFKTRNSFNSWHEALATIGRAYQNARKNIDIEGNYDNRELIGAPIMDGRRQVSFLDRHAKPYFLSVVKNRNGKYDGYIFCIPYVYLKQQKYENYLSAINDLNSKLKEKLEVVK